jgi:hypothetical protein
MGLNSLLKKSLPELFQHAKQKAQCLLCFIFKHLGTSEQVSFAVMPAKAGIQTTP